MTHEEKILYLARLPSNLRYQISLIITFITYTHTNLKKSKESGEDAI